MDKENKELISDIVENIEDATAETVNELSDNKGDE